MSESTETLTLKEKFNYRFISIVIIAWALDFITKIWAIGALAGTNTENYCYSANKTITVIGDFLRFSLVCNMGGVFGIFQGNPMVFQFLTGFAIIFLVFYYVKTPDNNRFFNLAISFILGGAFGNFTDRFFRPGVVDFIDMPNGFGGRWPTYNVADAFISIGAVLLAIAFFQMEKAAKEKAASEKVAESPEAK